MKINTSWKSLQEPDTTCNFKYIFLFKCNIESDTSSEKRTVLKISMVSFDCAILVFFKAKQIVSFHVFLFWFITKQKIGSTQKFFWIVDEISPKITPLRKLLICSVMTMTQGATSVTWPAILDNVGIPPGVPRDVSLHFFQMRGVSVGTEPDRKLAVFQTKKASADFWLGITGDRKTNMKQNFPMTAPKPRNKTKKSTKSEPINKTGQVECWSSETSWCGLKFGRGRNKTAPQLERSAAASGGTEGSHLPSDRWKWVTGYTMWDGGNTSVYTQQTDVGYKSGY